MDEPMTQFRAIPIEWGLSKNPYHKFLMWVAFKATFNGWGRCDALQVTFTIREAADETGSKPSTVSDWVKRAKADGLLLPTGSFSRETGKGEVYGLGGVMLMTVKMPGQGPDKDRTRTGQVDAVNSNGCDASPDKARTRPGQGPDALMVYTPDTPDTPTATSPSRVRKPARMRKIDLLDGYPEGALMVVRELHSIWPVHAGDRKLIDDPHTACARVTEILSTNPSLTPELLLESGKRYLKAIEADGSQKFTSALQFFFGPGKAGTMPKWEQQIRAMKHDEKMGGS